MSFGEFTDYEIRQELAHLGYHNVPQDKLEEFKNDLMNLISKERSKSNSLNSSKSAEQEFEEKNAQQREFTNSGSLVDHSFNNYGDQCIGKSKFKEDWQYKGENDNKSRPKTAPACCVDMEEENPFAILTRPCHRDDESVTSAENRFIKRKTSRKTDNGCRQIDESFTDTESGVFEIYERIKNLAMRECECGKTRPKSGDIDPPYRFKKGKVNTNPSLIKRTEPPHTRNLVRMDVNERHKMYRKIWKAQPAIGDDHRISLRKSVHARMMVHDDFKAKQKVFVPNAYIPPHEKLRKDVRWKVKKAFESYELPEHGFYHES